MADADLDLWKRWVKRDQSSSLFRYTHTSVRTYSFKRKHQHSISLKSNVKWLIDWPVVDSDLNDWSTAEERDAEETNARLVITDVTWLINIGVVLVNHINDHLNQLIHDRFTDIFCTPGGTARFMSWVPSIFSESKIGSCLFKTGYWVRRRRRDKHGRQYAMKSANLTTTFYDYENYWTIPLPFCRSTKH